MASERREKRPAAEKRKRRKPEKETKRTNMLLFAVIAIGALLSLSVVGAGIVFVVRLGEKDKLTAPDSFSAYESPEAVFHLDYPSGWKVSSSGIKGNYAVTIEKSSALIQVSESLRGSLIGDIANSGARGDESDERSPVAQVHAVKKQDLADEFNRYEEGKPEFVKARFGKVARSEFKASAGLGLRVHGFRATALAGMTSFDVVCQCSERNWEMLRPAFERAIASLGPGTGAP
jgi:hypothetical protein